MKTSLECSYTGTDIKVSISGKTFHLFGFEIIKHPL